MDERIIAKAKFKGQNNIVPILFYCLAAFMLIVGIIITEGDIEYLFFDFGLPFIFLTIIFAVFATIILLRKKALPECVVTDKRIYYSTEKYSVSIPNSMISSVTTGLFESIVIASPTNRINIYSLENHDEFYNAIISVIK